MSIYVYGRPERWWVTEEVRNISLKLLICPTWLLLLISTWYRLSFIVNQILGCDNYFACYDNLWRFVAIYFVRYFSVQFAWKCTNYINFRQTIWGLSTWTPLGLQVSTHPPQLACVVHQVTKSNSKSRPWCIRRLTQTLTKVIQTDREGINALKWNLWHSLSWATRQYVDL